MRREARRLGKRLVALERQLDRAFRSGSITDARLATLTAAIGAVEGRLRATHLRAHLRVERILTPGQVAHYDRLRGYAAKPGAHSGDHAGHG